jgi:hypothetical protein
MELLNHAETLSDHQIEQLISLLDSSHFTDDLSAIHIFEFSDDVDQYINENTLASDLIEFLRDEFSVGGYHPTTKAVYLLLPEVDIESLSNENLDYLRIDISKLVFTITLYHELRHVYQKTFSMKDTYLELENNRDEFEKNYKENYFDLPMEVDAYNFTHSFIIEHYSKIKEILDIMSDDDKILPLLESGVLGNKPPNQVLSD